MSNDKRKGSTFTGSFTPWRLAAEQSGDAVFVPHNGNEQGPMPEIENTAVWTPAHLHFLRRVADLRAALGCGGVCGDECVICDAEALLAAIDACAPGVSVRSRRGTDVMTDSDHLVNIENHMTTLAMAPHLATAADVKRIADAVATLARVMLRRQEAER